MHSITNDQGQSVTKVTDHLVSVRDRIAAAATKAGRDAATIQLLAVSKGQSVDKIRAAFAAGQRAFGENYLQEAEKKIELLRGFEIEWHFIGRIQSNKTRPIAERFAWVHTVDRAKVARRLSEQRPYHGPPLNICLQVNIAGESKKAGVSPNELGELVEAVKNLPRIRLRGLMMIPPAVRDPEDSAAHFRQLAELRSTLIRDGLDLDTLSMGMSQDMDVAIREGSTIVRVGTRNFRTTAAGPVVVSR